MKAHGRGERHARRQEVVTFKVDSSVIELMREMPNRSGFIRAALLTALDNTCPLCSGTGILTPKRKEHWKEFSQDHRVKKCGDCRELTIVCRNEK